MKLTVLVPTRGRPQNAGRLLAAFRETCVLRDTTVVFGVDEGDPERDRYLGAFFTNSVLLPSSARRGMVDGLNYMASCDWALAADFLGFMGDDHVPRTTGWDKQMCEALAGKPAALAYGNDLLQGERIPTAVVMTSSIPRTLGYMAPPELAHLYADDAWLSLGRALDAITYLPDVVIEHLHPAAGKADSDDSDPTTNAPSMFAADAAAYANYRATRLAQDVAKLQAIA